MKFYFEVIENLIEKCRPSILRRYVCFILIKTVYIIDFSMIECGLDVGKQKIQQACLPALKTLNSYSFAGAKILVEKLK